MYLSLIFIVTKQERATTQRKMCTRTCNSSVVNITNGNTRRTRLHTLSLIHKGINIMTKFLSTRQTGPRSVNIIPPPIFLCRQMSLKNRVILEHVGNLFLPSFIPYLRPLSFGVHKSGGRTREKLAFTTSSSSPRDGKGAIVALICMTEG